MNIIFVVYHPFECHLYKHVAEMLQPKNNVFFALLEKENIEQQILEKYGFNYYKIGNNATSRTKKIINIPFIIFRLLRIAYKFKTDYIISGTSPFTAIVAKLLRIPCFGFTDTETAKFNNRLAFPLFDVIFTPDCFYEKVPAKKHIPFKGYLDFAYLHPKVFSPQIDVLKKLNLSKDSKIVLMRFSALKAMHDFGLKSIGNENKDVVLHYINEIEKYANVFISTTEHNIGPEFKKYELNIESYEYIHLLAFCSLYIGEGTTTASEAGVLGVPWINIQKTTRGYLIDQEENYDLGFRTDNIDLAFKTAIEWIKRDDLAEVWKKKREKLLNDKINLSAFLFWFIENYPESREIMRVNPNYQDNFK